MEEFPFSQFRPGQKKAIRFILRQLVEKDKKYVILEAGTGVGKSAIAVAISQHLQKCLPVGDPKAYQPGTYYLTTQKILQDQYIKDFGEPVAAPTQTHGQPTEIEDLAGSASSYNGMTTVCSASNYPCCFYPKNTCADSQRLLKIVDSGSSFYKNCTQQCGYKDRKRHFLQNTDGVTNFAYFLAETTYAKEFKPRQLLVIDEAHNCDGILSQFIDITIRRSFTEKHLAMDLPELGDAAKAYLWVKTVYEPAIMNRKREIEQKIKQLLVQDKPKEESSLPSKRGGERSGGAAALTTDNWWTTKQQKKTTSKQSSSLEDYSKENELLDKHACKVRRFLQFYHQDRWVLSTVMDQELGMIDSIEFRPATISSYARELIFQYGHKVLLMSATILNKKKFCLLNGLDPKEVAFISIPSPFPAQNKPIIFLPSGGMNRKQIDYTLPKMARSVIQILRKHPDQKGIIHCHSYKIVNYLEEHLIKSSIKSRLLCHDVNDREAILTQHQESKDPTVLLSPSMTEGVDLKDDISRFQIICKIPYPYLGDKVVQTKMQMWHWWYSFETAKKMIQSVGRSVRHMDDFATTYILDSDWSYFYSDNHGLFPKEWHQQCDVANHPSTGQMIAISASAQTQSNQVSRLSHRGRQKEGAAEALTPV